MQYSNSNYSEYCHVAEIHIHKHTYSHRVCCAVCGMVYNYEKSEKIERNKNKRLANNMTNYYREIAMGEKTFHSNGWR